MSKLSPQEMATILAKGLLSFPVTHFDKDFQFQEGPYREHCAWLLGFKRLTGLFAAGGPGAFFFLPPPRGGAGGGGPGRQAPTPSPGGPGARPWAPPPRRRGPPGPQ